MRRLAQDSRGVERTTIVLPRVLNANVDLFCLAKGVSKGELVREAITDYLVQRKMDPTVMPRIKLPVVSARNNRAVGVRPY